MRASTRFRGPPGGFILSKTAGKIRVESSLPLPLPILRDECYKTLE
ncbi:MAG: hypothetical protein AB1656_27110 [Candidatus Omnitrophota bacterium]